MFFFQYLVLMGVFFAVPLYLSVALGMSALETGVRILPLSLTLLLGALGIPKLLPRVSPRRIVLAGMLLLLVGTLIMLGALTPTSDARALLVPLLLIGLGLGALASQLGAVTVSAVPDEMSPEVGGVQNTVTNLGASFGTALAGSILIAVLTTSFIQNVNANPAVPASVKETATVQLASGVPFTSDADLRKALEKADLTQAQEDAIVDANASARISGLRAALALLALFTAIGLFFTSRIPSEPVGSGLDPEPAVP
jgi:MFS family permease